MKEFQPMLAAALAPDEVAGLEYPRYLSPKLDGIRAVVRGGKVLSRKLKPIPSLLVQKIWGKAEFEGLDGELITGAANAPDAFLRTTSAVMRINSDPDEIALTHFHVFDCVVNEPFSLRLSGVQAAARMYPSITEVPQELITGADQLLALEDFLVEQGFEGVMLRKPDSPYKFGRSTLNEGYLLKLKRFTDDEYEVTGFEEKMHNANPQTRDERGYAKRSSHQDNLVGMDTLGAILGKMLTGPFAGEKIKVTPTGSHGEQHAIWLNQAAHLGTIRKVKYFLFGSKDLPRFPVDIGPRKD